MLSRRICKVVSTCLIQIIVLMLILGFQINILLDNDSKIIYDTAIAFFIIILLVNKIAIRFIIFFVIFSCVGILSNDLLRWFYMVFPFYFGFLLKTRYNQRVRALLVFVVISNFVIVIYQLSGINEIFYSYQNYYSPDKFVYLLTNSADLDIVSPIQGRPSGIFPSTIYQSAFQFFLTAYFFLNSGNINKLFCFFLALFFVSTGSTVSLFLSISILFLGTNRPTSRWFFYCFLVGMILYFFLLPPIFFQTNYEFSSVIRHLVGRLYFSQVPDSPGTVSGVFLKDPILFLGVAIVVNSYLCFNRKLNLPLKKSIFVSILAFGPLILHDLLKSVFYWFLIGYIYGNIHSIRLDYLSKSIRRLGCQIGMYKYRAQTQSRTWHCLTKRSEE